MSSFKIVQWKPKYFAPGKRWLYKEEGKECCIMWNNNGTIYSCPLSDYLEVKITYPRPSLGD